MPACRATSACPVSDSALGQIVGRQLNRYLVTSQNTYVVLAHLAGDMGGHNVTVFELYPEHGVGQGLCYRAFHFNVIFFCHLSSLVRWLNQPGSIPEFRSAGVFILPGVASAPDGRFAAVWSSPFPARSFASARPGTPARA